VGAIYPFPRVIIHSDAVGALAAGTGRMLGIVLIAGTGTIALATTATGALRGRLGMARYWPIMAAVFGSVWRRCTPSCAQRTGAARQRS